MMHHRCIMHSRDRFSHWSDAFPNVSRFPKEETRATFTELAPYMAELVAAKRAEPGEDLLSMLIVESAAPRRPNGSPRPNSSPPAWGYRRPATRPPRT